MDTTKARYKVLKLQETHKDENWSHIRGGDDVPALVIVVG